MASAQVWLMPFLGRRKVVFHPNIVLAQFKVVHAQN